MEKETSISQAKPYLLGAVGITVSMMMLQSPMLIHALGKIAWTGISKSAVAAIITAIINGASIFSAAAGIIGAIAAGPIVAVLTAVGRGLLVKMVKRYGLKWVIAW